MPATGSARAVGWPQGSRAILHVDLDCFFAAVEQLKDRSLQGAPVIVGGLGNRGVVAAASYEARVYGVRSAMPIVTARRLCPRGVFLQGDYAAYASISRAFREILDRFTPLVEAISLDEAFLDVTGSKRLFGEPIDIGRRIREEISHELGLVACVGAGPSKQIAKLASRSAKPTVRGRSVVEGPGVLVVRPEEALAFIGTKAIREIWGIGPASAKKLESMGVATVADLRAVPEAALRRSFGVAGSKLLALAHGIDADLVSLDRQAKSISHEQTFSVDLSEPDAIHAAMLRLAEAVARRLWEQALFARTITLKVRATDFSTVTRSKTLDDPTRSFWVIQRIASDLLGSVDIGCGVRLVGVVASGLGGEPPRQVGLDFEDRERSERLEEAVFAVKQRFGASSVAQASTMSRGRIKAVREGEFQWGPREDLRPSTEDLPASEGAAEESFERSGPTTER